VFARSSTLVILGKIIKGIDHITFRLGAGRKLFRHITFEMRHKE